MSGASPTQRRLARSDVARLVAASFGSGVGVAECGPMGGGGFAAVWWVDLDDGRRAVLKVAPPPDVPLLRYEQGMIAAEARYFRLVAARAPRVPVPPVLHYGADPAVLDGDWLFTGRLPGRSLPDLSRQRPDIDSAPVRAAFGAALADVHAVTGDRFGYDDGRTGGATWRGAFTAMLDDLLADAADWAVELPVTQARLHELVGRHADMLDAVHRPALLHFDGWDGNVLAEPGADGVLRMTGLVDGERYLFGDPVLDLVSPALYRRIEDEPEHPFLRGYAAATRPPLVLHDGIRRRLALYRLHLYLLMTVEMPSRSITPQSNPGRYERLACLLEEELTGLGRPAATRAV
ncbi:phosphotransferase family protein [Rugosimonospora africana]|uniref:Aminoglycoside phosphotransferase n=1 Tax=Rugosimonospora africana TaxID=556532 RepID=A0A8J3QP68_9ACTN|nr:aminoglycoside phosphotransferase family protein [Rugosimonospora africana]GIH14459.1 aminoglycoside phosphotransferase [Rugosimonospora africana]